jgi:ADP-ribose pyrophosphatase YjhB (NUDIX family)
MDRTMIAFDAGRVRFSFRVTGVAVRDGRVLLQHIRQPVRRQPAGEVALPGERVPSRQVEIDDFWCLPGGRAELLEPAADTLRREMREELGVAVGVERLLWVVENFFDHDGRAYHELGLYFAMALPPDAGLHARTGPFAGDEAFHEGGIALVFQWQPLDRLGGLALYPTFLRQALRALPATTAHLVHRDGEGAP